MLDLLVRSLAVAVALGLLEAAWTGPGRGGPVRTWLGVAAIGIALAAVSWPLVWWIPALAILEELTHIVAQGARPTWDTVFRHWSTGYLGGVNVYPYLTFPALTAVGEVLVRIGTFT